LRRAFGIRSTADEWIESFITGHYTPFKWIQPTIITGRVQNVIFASEKSAESNVPCSVPQGRVLFLLYELNWAIGLPVCSPVRLPSLACTRAPRKPRRPSRLPPVPAARDRPFIQATPVVTHRDSPISIYRLLYCADVTLIIAQRHNISVDSYADDTQLYVHCSNQHSVLPHQHQNAVPFLNVFVSICLVPFDSVFLATFLSKIVKIV